jgi:hypothetical protein
VINLRSGSSDCRTRKAHLFRDSEARDEHRSICVIPFADTLREHLLSLPTGDKPRLPVHPRAYEIIHAQGGRVGMLSRQFAELLAAAGLRQPRSHNSRGIGRAGKRQYSN